MILGIDATNWIHSLWHAQSGKGVLDSACRRMNGLVDRLHPRHVVACFDRRSFRHDIFPAYKSKRKEKPERLCADLAEGPAAVADLATVFAEDGFEADDCLASLARAGQLIGEKVVVASPDKDLRQCLVAGEVTILRSFVLRGDGVIDLDWFTADRLHKEYALSPAQWPDFQALCGDSTDGIPGCVGWGEKTSLAALHKAGSLAEILRNPWALSITQKQQGNLMAFKPHADKMLRLVTLCTEVPGVWDVLR